MVAMREIRKFSDAIVREFSPQRIILFGSHARGDAYRDSDVDLLVVMPYRGHPVEKAIEIRRKLERTFPLDLLVRSPADIRRRLGIDDPFIREILDQGKVLYDADDRGVGQKGSRLPKPGTRASREKDRKL